MPRGSPAAIAAIVVSFLALALVVVGAVVLTRHQQGLGLALAAAGFAGLVLGGRLTPRQPARRDDDRASREA